MMEAIALPMTTSLPAADLEQRILDEIRRGHRQRFAELYDLYARRIYAFIAARVSHRPTAEDLTSVVFLKALEHLETFRRGSFSAWLFRIARNSVIDHYRTAKNGAPLEAAFAVGDGTNLDDDVERRQLLDEVQRRLTALTPIQRDVVTMRVWDDLPYAAIAEIVGKSEPAVKMLFSRAVTAMRLPATTAALLLLALLN